MAKDLGFDLSQLRALNELGNEINQRAVDTMQNVPIDMVVSKVQVRKKFENLEEIALAETATAATESIQKQTGEEGFSLENVLTDTESEEGLVEKIALRQAINALPERERTVIQLRYFHCLTQQRVAKVMQVSQVQVSRIEKKALTMLKELMA